MDRVCIFLLSIHFFVYCFGDQFGDYKICVTDVRNCKHNVSNTASLFDIKFVPVAGEKYDTVITAVIPEGIGPLLIRLKLGTIINGKPKLRINRVLTNICQNEPTKRFMKYSTFMDPNNCYLRKGNFTVVIPDYNTMVHSMTGEKFLYGNYSTHLQGFVGKNVIFCSKYATEFLPLRNT